VVIKGFRLDGGRKQRAGETGAGTLDVAGSRLYVGSWKTLENSHTP